MTQVINKPISVSLIYDHRKRKSLISKLLWNNRVYILTTQGLHHTFHRGNDLIHIFSVATETINFKLEFDSASLNWTLLELYDPNFD